MDSLTAERPDPLRWILAPMAACVAATLLCASPIRVFSLSLPEPVFAMVPCFAWAVLRPSLVAPLCLLLLGLFDDLLWGGRLGVWGLGLLVTYGVVLISRNFMLGQGRLMNWLWYALVTSIGMGAAYAAVVLEARNSPGLLAVAGQWLPTALLFPLAERLIGRFEDADPRFR